MKCWICGQKADPNFVFKSNRLQAGSLLKRSSYQKITSWCASCYKASEEKQAESVQRSCDELKSHAESLGIDTSEW